MTNDVLWRQTSRALASARGAIVTQKIRNNIELLATLIRGTNGKGSGTARSRAIITYCALVGAIGMARAVSDEELSREILKTVSQRLKERWDHLYHRIT